MVWRIQPHSFAHGKSVVPALLVEKIFSPLNYFGTLIENQLSINVRVYFWTLNPIPLICVYNVMPVPYCLDHCCFIVSFKIKKCKPSKLSSFSRLFWLFWVSFYSFLIVCIVKVCQIFFQHLLRWSCGFCLYSISMGYCIVICWTNSSGINLTWLWCIILFICLILFASILIILGSSCTCFFIRQSTSKTLNISKIRDRRGKFQEF